MQVLRNVFRRKVRVFLTISGITIGVLALVVMGSMAERINVMVSGGTRFYADKVTVTAAGGASMFGNSLLSLKKREEIKAVPGVLEVSASVGTLLDPEAGMSFGMPPILLGDDMRGDRYESFRIEYAAGRPSAPGSWVRWW